MVKWECVECGKIHRSNPSKCSKCGSTILRQNRNESWFAKNGLRILGLVIVVTIAWAIWSGSLHI